MSHFKYLSLKQKKEVILYRNKIINRRNARNLTFHDKSESYYDIRLKELDRLCPEFKGIGRIYLK